MRTNGLVHLRIGPEAVASIGFLLTLAFTYNLGCGPGSQSTDAAMTPDASDQDPDPVFTDEEHARIATMSPTQLPAPPADVTNRFADDPMAAQLGQRFFFDPGFAGPLLSHENDGSPNTLGMFGQTGRVACVGCHIPTSGFIDTRSPSRQLSLASDWSLYRRARSLLDVGQAKLLMWDGRADALYNQVFIPYESHSEVNSSRLYIAEQVFARYRQAYESLFHQPLDRVAQLPVIDAAHAGCQRTGVADAVTCHGLPGDGAEYDGLSPDDKDLVTGVLVNVGKAIGAYLRLLSCGTGRFDAWAHGQTDALTRSEQRGAALFTGRARCWACHTGPFLTDQLFHNVGLSPSAVVGGTFIDTNDRGAGLGLSTSMTNPLNSQSHWSDGYDGRLPTQVDPALEGTFRTPSLRCVSTRPSFFHTAQLRTLDDVVGFFNTGGSAGGFVGHSEIRALGLSTQDRADLVAFLHALDGSGPPANLLVAPPAQ